jgi:hypothetical protein
MNLNDREKEQPKALIDAGQPLPPWRMSAPVLAANFSAAAMCSKAGTGELRDAGLATIAGANGC